MPTKLARFTDKVVSVPQKAVTGAPAPAVSKGESGYTDWVIVSIHDPQEYLNQPYLRLMEILYDTAYYRNSRYIQPSYLTSRRSVGENRNSKRESGIRSFD
jgi:hypothetical protein